MDPNADALAPVADAFPPAHCEGPRTMTLGKGPGHHGQPEIGFVLPTPGKLHRTGGPISPRRGGVCLCLFN